MTATLIGYARCSTDEQDLIAQRQILHQLGVAEDRVYLDHGLTGTIRARPGLDQSLAAVRAGDTLVVPKFDRLARSVPDARDIGDSLAARGIRLSTQRYVAAADGQGELTRIAATMGTSRACTALTSLHQSEPNPTFVEEFAHWPRWPK